MFQVSCNSLQAFLATEAALFLAFGGKLPICSLTIWPQLVAQQSVRTPLAKFAVTLLRRPAQALLFGLLHSIAYVKVLGCSESGISETKAAVAAVETFTLSLKASFPKKVGKKESTRLLLVLLDSRFSFFFLEFIQFGLD